MPIVAFLSITNLEKAAMIWTVINVDFKTDLRVIEGTLIGFKHQKDILYPIVKPNAGAV